MSITLGRLPAYVTCSEGCPIGPEQDTHAWQEDDTPAALVALRALARDHAHETGHPVELTITKRLTFTGNEPAGAAA